MDKCAKELHVEKGKNQERCKQKNNIQPGPENKNQRPKVTNEHKNII
jgi:hypothetical protein